MSQFDAAWTPNVMPYWAETQTPAMALFPDRAIAWGEIGGAGVGYHNRNGERKRCGGGNQATTEDKIMATVLTQRWKRQAKENTLSGRM